MGMDRETPNPETPRRRNRIWLPGALLALAAVVLASAPVSAGSASPGSAPPPGQSYGPSTGLHVQVEGAAPSGYRAVIYDGRTFVTGRGMVGPYDLTVTPTVQGTETVSCTLGSTNDCTGLEQNDVAGDGVTQPVTVAGLSARETVTVVPGDVNMYFNVPGVFNVDDSATFTVQYYDTGTNGWFLEYDSANSSCGPVAGAYCAAGGITNTNSGTWKTATFTANDVRFAGRENGGNDFRIASSAPVIIHSVAVTITGQFNGAPVHLQNHYTKVAYSPSTQTLTLSGAVDTVEGTTVSRFETYRFVNSQTVASTVGITASASTTAYYTPYTDFPASWQPMWAGGDVRSLSTPTGNDTAQDSPIPVLGVTDGRHVYGVASGATWDYPVPGYNTPHLVVSGNRLAAPQMGSASHPIVLGPGATQQWETVFFRTPGSTPYAMELGGEAAMAEALGFTPQNSPGLTVPAAAGPSGSLAAERRQAAADFGLLMRATAYWLRESPGGSGQALPPSPHYSPGTYMRDSFWTALGLTGSPLFASTETAIFNDFTAQIPTSGPNAGGVPVALGGPIYPDEGSMLYLIRMFDDAVVHHLPVKNLSVAQLVLDHIQTTQVKNGAWLTVAPQAYSQFTYSPDTWLDGYLYPQGAESGYAQGLYVTALMAAQKLGLGVTNAQIQQADQVYRSLYDPQLGYIRWLSTTTYKGPDVLTGDALSLLLFNTPLLPEAMVSSTLAHQDFTPYGMAALATQSNGYVPATDFETLELSDSYQVVGVGEPGGWYQNGGFWFLYTYLAEWAAARQGDPQAQALMGRSIENQVAVTPMSKEFALTSTAPTYPYPAGSSSFQRQGYGWNAAYIAFARALPPSGAAAPPVSAPAPAQLPASPAPAGQSFGPRGGMHVVVTGTAATGLAADIVDGNTLVSKRGMDGADLTVLSSSGPIQLQNRYTTASYDPQTSTLTLSGAVNSVDGTTLTRYESYRFMGSETIQAFLGISASGGGSTTRLYYSPYTDFPASWMPLRPIANNYSPHYWFTTSYSSPVTGGSGSGVYGVPLLGVYSGRYIYGIASGDTWQYPIDGYSNPHLTIQGTRLGAPQIGDASNPISLAPGSSRKWMQVFYRSQPSAYRFVLDGEVDMAEALGFSAQSSPGVTGPLSAPGLPAAPVSDPAAVQEAMRDWGLILDATAYWELQTTPSGARTVVPSNAYTPRSFMRDSFWTLLGLPGPLGDQAEAYVMQLFNANVIQSGPSAGVVPTDILPPNQPGYGIIGSGQPPAGVDESNLLYIIRMYYDAEVRHLSGVLNLHDAQLALQWVENNRVKDNQVIQDVTTGGDWMDTIVTPIGSVNTYTQGLYAVALMAAQKMGLSVPDSQIQGAQAAYDALYNPTLGYLPWNSDPSYAYRSPDVLAGEAWSLFLFNRSILPTGDVASTLRALVATPYGMADVAAADGGYLDSTNSQVALQGISYLDAPGHYQNGGDWFLFNYWAAYAGARLGIAGARSLVAWDAGRELAVLPTSDEYGLTNAFMPFPAPVTDETPASPPSYRQGYGWNAAFNAFTASLGRPVSGGGA